LIFFAVVRLSEVERPDWIGPNVSAPEPVVESTAVVAEQVLLRYVSGDW